MNGVDLVDYHAKIGGGLAQIGHYKKWYKKVHHAVTDFMIHQGRVGWNMSCTNRDLRRRELSTWEFQAVLAEEWISFVDETQQNTTSETIEANALDLVIGGHRPSAAPSSKRNYCCVCKIEENIISRLDSRYTFFDEAGNFAFEIQQARRFEKNFFFIWRQV